MNWERRTTGISQKFTCCHNHDFIDEQMMFSSRRISAELKVASKIYVTVYINQKNMFNIILEVE